MNLPRAVVEAERKAEEAFQQLQQARQPQQQPTDQPPADPQASDPAPSSSPSEIVAQAIAAPAPAPQPEGDEKWEARYKTLHGKYNAEVPRLHAALKERDSKLNSLTEEVEALKAQTEVRREPLVKPEEVSEYGEPLVDLIRRAARDELAGKETELARLRKEVESIKSTTVQTKEVGFFEKLAAAVPDWMATNDDPDFHAWLGEVDELTGAQRQSILSEAEEKRDADRVARFFNAFKKVQGEKSAAASVALESQVSPTATRTPEAPRGKKIWTRQEVANFYARAKSGEFSDQDATAIEQEIDLAIRERRIR